MFVFLNSDLMSAEKKKLLYLIAVMVSELFVLLVSLLNFLIFPVWMEVSLLVSI